MGVTWEFGRVPEPPEGVDPDSESLEYDWAPKPFPTDHISVPPEVKKLGELLAENVHDVSCPITWGTSRCAVSCAVCGHLLHIALCCLSGLDCANAVHANLHRPFPIASLAAAVVLFQAARWLAIR